MMMQASCSCFIYALLLITPVHGYDLLINASAGGGFYLDMMDGATNETIGRMYQDPIFDSTGTRIGTNQGYVYYFDNPENDTEMNSNSNRYMFLDGGNSIMLNSFIVASGGIPSVRSYLGSLSLPAPPSPPSAQVVSSLAISVSKCSRQ